MKQGEQLVEINFLITEESYDDYFKRMKKVKRGKNRFLASVNDDSLIYDLMNTHFHVREMTVTKASVQEIPSQLRIQKEGCSHAVIETGWKP